MIIPGREVARTTEHKISFADGVMGRVETDERGMPRVTYLPPLNVDVIVFQRPLDWIVAQCIPLAQAQGVAVVVELDDDVRHVDPANTAHARVQPRTSPVSNWAHLIEACKRADWVTVSTPALTGYAPHGRVSVVPNTLPRSVLTVPLRPMRDTPVVCWPGAVATHPRDLQECGTSVARATAEFGGTFSVVGAGDGVRAALSLSYEPVATGWLPLHQYPETLRDVADVGIVPLADTRFNRAKSWLKGLEMAGLGIPFVASPLPEYRRLADMGAGDLAKNPYEWGRALTRIVQDGAYRDEMITRGRQVVAERLTIDKVVDRWVGAWSSALEHRAAARATSRVAVGV
jgi:glycosyltransferase involved in cell wall biosynthesis